MCGISGFLYTGKDQPTFEAKERLRRMIATVRHRGPDDVGVWTEGPCGLAHARLSILDLSPAGHQPMASHDGRLWISFNGEIYNFLELRSELEAKGYKFRSRCDTEVIVNGYDAWGVRILDRLRGMFAFALWDARERQLLLARDRFGKKPLYYTKIDDFLLFGSEIKSLLTWPQLKREPDYRAIDQFLTLQYIPAPRTGFLSICKLRSAHYMIAKPAPDGSWAISEQTEYWRLPMPNAARSRASSNDLAVELVERLAEAVKLRLIADVPLGAFLSGGVDSSAIVALMAQNASGPVKTFSVGFPNEEYNETRYARIVAERYGTDHEEIIVEPDAASVIPRLVWHYGEPFADSSAVPTYYLSEAARRKVTVALNGDGGDEAFMGYTRYALCRNIARMDGLPSILRKIAASGIRLIPPVFSRSQAARLATLADLVDGPQRSGSQRYAPTIVGFFDSDKAEAYSSTMQGILADPAFEMVDPYFAVAPSLVSGANWADIHTYLPDDLMVKVDVASMAHGLESRSPLLDHVFMEWAMTIPESIKMEGGITKALFKKAMEPYLPRDLLYRPKMGFGCPVDHWLREELKEMAYDVLLSSTATARGIFRKDYVRRLLDEHISYQNNHHVRLWTLLMLELWFRMWIDRDLPLSISSTRS